MGVKRKAQKFLRGISKPEILRIEAAFSELRKSGSNASSVKVLTDLKNVYRKRVGRWRILFEVNEAIKKVTIWIIDIERDKKKDYRRWKGFIRPRL